MESLLPFLQGTCTPYNMPVYPGAQCIIANALIDRRISTGKSASRLESCDQSYLWIAVTYGVSRYRSPVRKVRSAR